MYNLPAQRPSYFVCCQRGNMRCMTQNFACRHKEPQRHENATILPSETRPVLFGSASKGKLPPPSNQREVLHAIWTSRRIQKLREMEGNDLSLLHPGKLKFLGHLKIEKNVNNRKTSAPQGTCSTDSSAAFYRCQLL